MTGTKGTVNAKTLAVEGDFFTFHQLAFRFGGHFLYDNSNPMGVVLDRDLFTVAPAEIGSVKPEATYIDGKQVFSATGPLETE